MLYKECNAYSNPPSLDMPMNSHRGRASRSPSILAAIVDRAHVASFA